MAKFLVTAKVSDVYVQTVKARDEKEALTMARSRPEAWSLPREDSDFDAREILTP
jgi:predicted nucleotidyltransferase